MTESPFNSRVIDIVQSHKVPYRLLSHSRPVFTCEEAAQERGVPIEEMVKCMVYFTKKDNKGFLVCVPALKRVSMSKLKKETGVKKFSIPDDDLIVMITGFQKGAIPPLALNPEVIALADESILELEKINISSGLHEAGLEISVLHFKALFKGVFVSVIK